MIHFLAKKKNDKSRLKIQLIEFKKNQETKNLAEANNENKLNRRSSKMAIKIYSFRNLLLGCSSELLQFHTIAPDSTCTVLKCHL